MAGALITLEGIDGCGKTTQARLLVQWLRGHGYHVLPTREPGGTEPGDKLRELLLSPQYAITPEAELFLYLADRALHAAQVIRPALAEGRIVVCERHADSTLAYQGAGRGLDLDLLARLNRAATGGLRPHLTLLFDLDPKLGLARRERDSRETDRLDREPLEFHLRVRAHFLELARREPGRFVVLDAALPPERLEERVGAAIERRLGAGPSLPSRPD